MFIYIITNILNEKKYIGITTRGVDRRLSEHIAGYDKSNLLSRAIKKYGMENFHIECLEVSDKLGPYWEKHLIQRWGALVPKGYNIAEGGNIPPSKEGKPRTEETKRKISEALKGRICPEWHRQRMREGHNPNQRGENHPHKRQVVLIHPDGKEERFGYLKAAAKKYNLHYGNLSHRGHSLGYRLKENK